ncbi:hypothetical protein LTR08_002407 [Meristemomyces frigidus]|nr:hypothetical protein LTR08_002407 [Meristemomyces frigidus]
MRGDGGNASFPDGNNMVPFANMQQPSEKKMVLVDVGALVRTRDALSSAYMSLSHSIDKAVKAYIDHTNVVLAGDGSLNVSFLTAPLDQFPRHAVMAQQALQHGAMQMQTMSNGAVAVGGAQAEALSADTKPEKRKKRAYKQRDPNAPKRPLTAYFRYLQEQRGPLGVQMKAQNDGVPSRPGDLSKEATERWNALSKTDQQPYRDAYQRALKDYEKEVVKYKAEAESGKVGEATDPVEEAGVPDVDADAEHDEEDEDVDDDEVAGATPKALDIEEDEDDSDEVESSDEEVMAPPPAPKEKTPKSAMKKSKQSVPPTPLASNIDPALAAPASSAVASSSSPERKRKATAVLSDTTEAEAGGRKKRGRKTNAEKAAEEAAPVALMTEEPAKKRKKRKVDA